MKKRGDASLIATVILIVLAIGVGVLVANFSQRTEEKVTERIIVMGDSVECTDINIGVEGVESNKITLKNRGTLGIDQIAVRIYPLSGDVVSDSPNPDESNMDVERLLPGDTGIYTASDLLENINKVEIIPIFVTQSDELLGCENRMVVWRP